MYEPPPSLCPNEIHPRVDGVGTDEEVVVRAALRQPHVGIFGIEHILPALVILDMPGAEQAVQLLRRHAQFLGNLRSGEARDAVQHRVGVERLGQQAADLLLLLGDDPALAVEQSLLLTNELVLLLQGGSQHLLSPAADVLPGVALTDGGYSLPSCGWKEAPRRTPSLGKAQPAAW